MALLEVRVGTEGSDESRVLPQEHERAPLHRRWVDQFRLREPSIIPELEPVKVVRAESDIVFVSVVLEEKHFVAPERGGRLRSRDYVADQSLFAAMLGRRVVAKDLKHYSVLWDDGELVEEVVLILVGPTVDVVRLDIDLERPVRFLLLFTVLVKLGDLHD